MSTIPSRRSRAANAAEKEELRESSGFIFLI